MAWEPHRGHGLLATVIAGLMLSVGAAGAVAPLTVVAPPADPGGAGSEAVACVPHPPIVIAANEGTLGFISGYDGDGEPIYRPGSGVVAGAGTADDPYLISGWCLQSLGIPFIVPAISIQATTAHVEVRDNEVGSVLKGGRGIHLLNTVNVDVIGNVITNNDWDGVRLQNADHTRVVGNIITDNSRYGVLVADGTNNAMVADNEIRRNAQYGVYVLRAHGNTVDGNTLADNQVGVRFLVSNANTVTNNEITGNDWGVFHSFSSGNVVSDNNIHGNEDYGAEVIDSSLDARANWWGCPDGPGGAGCDVVATLEGGSVTVDPFRAEPVPGAGV